MALEFVEGVGVYSLFEAQVFEPTEERTDIFADDGPGLTIDEYVGIEEDAHGRTSFLSGVNPASGQGRERTGRLFLAPPRQAGWCPIRSPVARRAISPVGLSSLWKKSAYD